MNILTSVGVCNMDGYLIAENGWTIDDIYSLIILANFFLKNHIRREHQFDGIIFNQFRRNTDPLLVLPFG